MSRQECLVITCGVAALLLNAIFPPFKSSGYGFLFAGSPVEIATGLLLAQSVGIAALTLLLTLAFRLVPPGGILSLTVAVSLAAMGVVALLPLYEPGPLLRGAVGGDLYPIADFAVTSLFLVALCRGYVAFQSHGSSSAA